jgi:hypothetical protein
LDDYEIDTPEREGEDRYAFEPPPPRAWRTALIAAVFLLAAGVTGVFLYFRKPAVKVAAPPAPVTAAPTAEPASAVPLPSLAGSDDFVRGLAKGLSSNAAFATWLAGKELVRTFVAVVTNVAEGENPAAHVPFLAPRTPFRVVESKGRILVDPRSYDRFDALGDVAASLDTAECARVYGLAEPLFEAAYRELGHPEGGFARALGKAIDTLIKVPVPDANVPLRRVVRAVTVYEYADPHLEELGFGAKALLRTGPRNVPRIQAKLREISSALGLSGASPR